MQKQILEVSKNYVKKNGTLLYSTCTILDEENIDIIDNFIESNPEYKLVSIENEMCNSKKISTLKDGYMKLYPSVHNTDGFFIAKMIKEG